MKKHTRKIIYGVIIILFCIFVYFRNDMIAKWNNIEFYSFSVSLFINIALLAYKLDMKTFFLIRKIWNVIANPYTSWELSGKLRFTIDKDIIDNIERIILSKYDAKLQYHETNSLQYTIDNEFNLKLRFIQSISSETSEIEKHIYFSTSKVGIPFRNNTSKIQKLRQLLGDIKSTIDIVEECYDLTINFETKNPYYGLWLKRIPDQNILNFNCKISLPQFGESFKINKDTIFLRTKDFNEMIEQATKHVFLRGY